MTAATRDRSLQEREADGGNVTHITLMEFTEENVPLDVNLTVSLTVCAQDDTLTALSVHCSDQWYARKLSQSPQLFYTRFCQKP